MVPDERIEHFVQDGEVYMTVIEAVAEAIGIAPHKLQTRLYDRVDPDGLDLVFSERGNGAKRLGATLEFELVECDVVVHSEGRVVVTPPSKLPPIAQQQSQTEAPPWMND